MNDILFGNNNQAVIRKMAQRNLAANRERNMFLVLSVFMTTFMISTILSLCSNQIEMQRRYAAQYLRKAETEIEPVIYVLLLMAVLVAAAGFLLIYNVMSISVAGEIRFYGLLRTIGMSAKQINKMVLRQVRLLCAVGIPAGLIFSAVISLAVVPVFLSMYPQFLLEGYSAQFHPLTFVSAAVSAFLATMAGAFKPAWKAANVPPVAAVRFTESGYTRKKFHSSPFSPVKMAWRNVLRTPKRSILVFCSLFLGVTVFMAVSVILGSAGTDMFAQTSAASIRGDIYLRNGRAAEYSFGTGSSLNIFDSEWIDSLSGLPGLQEMNVGYFHEIRMDVTDGEGRIHNYPGYVYGIGAEDIAELSKELSSPVDEAAFGRGEFVIVRNLWKEPPFDADSVEFMIGNGETAVTFEVGGVLPAVYQDYYGTGYNRLPCVYMSDELLKKLVGEPAVYEIILSIEKEAQEQAFEIVQELVTGNENIILQSEIAIRQEAENIVAALTVIGNSISVILWLTGILNFVNVIMTNVLSHRHEIALLESVGQSAGQSKKMLVCEGLIYAIGTLALAGTFGSAIICGLFLFMKQQFEYMVFTFPLASFLIMTGLIVVICFIVPQMAYRSISKGTVSERLK